MDPANLLRKSARLFGRNTAFVCEERSQTYDQLLERAIRLANALRAAGVQPGDRVALLGDNAFESLEQIAGTAIGGYVRCALYGHDTADRHHYLLGLVGARALIVQDRHLAALRPMLADLPELTTVLVTGQGPAHGVTGYEDALSAASTEDPQVPLTDDDPHVIRFSAGTTGKPKGILHTVRGWMDMGTEMALVIPRFTERDRYLAPAPLSHAAGMFAWPLVAAGAATVVMPAFDTARFLELIESERITVTMTVPTLMRMIAEHPDSRTRDLSSLVTVFYGTAPAPEATLAAAIGVWGNIMYQIYGQSECLPLTVLTPEHHVLDGTDDQRRWLRSAGRPTPNSDVAILDDDGNRLPDGEIGEIAGRSPGTMRELWAAPEATAQRVTPDGWFRTRDMGRISDDGFLHLTDRKEDTIISGGYNIWPTELEDALAEHPAVAEAAVVGVPHARWGETPHAAVVLRPDAHVDPDELIAWSRERVGSVKKVTAVHLVDSLPRSPIGKVLRREVRTMLATPDRDR
ncbi:MULTISPECIES: class I adenylate-forming enzyme family protein [Pseudonocardia]|uniref:Long-chain-fatty-acid--CoA ligase FadD13 n=2 Tax=Pseudonocardia TaxID=1847 RepID=A0A1Y2N4M5_PSEAH|nr:MULTISPECIES: AMP-binding protein [Pseudonocardia]OSY42121.1 Long-chain-fatty-acid--CoA ligase FadD13 [Pseudonocardia autotrophica]TDN75111.1 acyl-CoA synthetase (AMP-forming)/AMP-acid ligase II [Pseudonocardia autotrophica]BBF99056.1 AMP-dependent acyl-CoA synthetase [Pseudonocardia autotrophica]GEC23976.1 AMP-dependent acyl-CoA synthetase [Pseudonocardia saturnea]